MKTWFILCTAVLLASCATPQPRLDFDPKADFTRLHTFAWLADDPLFQPRDSDTSISLLNRRRIVEGIEAALLAKGFVRAERRESADFTVAYTIGTRERLSVMSAPEPFLHPWPWGWSPYRRDVDVFSYTEGSLSIDILDGPTRQPIWHGVSRQSLSPKDLDAAGERLPRAITLILAPFPPR